MKKYILVILSLITALSLLPIKATAAFAVESEESGIETGIFLPTSYLQYYKLDNPYAICRYTDEEGAEVVAISHENEIIIYRNEKFSKIDVSAITDGKPVTVVDKYKNYILFLYASRIYSIDITGFSEPTWANVPVYTGIYSSLGFSVSGNVLLTNDNNGVRFNEIDESAETFRLKAEEYNAIDQINTVNLLYSADGNVYYTTDIGDIYRYDTTEKKSEVLWRNVTGIRSIAESGDGEIYYSCNSGIYALSVTEKSVRQIAAISADEEQDLGGVYDPKGVCVTGKGLWVVDGAINAVQEIDLTDNSFTKFAITTNSKAINRLSAGVKDLCVDGDKIYALDGDRIVVINDIDGDNTYNAIYLSAVTDVFAVGGGKILYYRSGTLYLDEIVGEGEILGIDNKKNIDCPNVKAISYSDGEFFVLIEELNDGEIYPIIKKIDAKTSDYKVVDYKPDVSLSHALKITADVFGNVYYAVEDGEEFKFYELGVAAPLYIRDKNGETLCKLQTDMDGKLYAEYSGNKIECYAGGEEIFSKTLKLSDNLSGMTEDSVSMCLSYNSETAYFLFKGLILKSSKAEDMRISTPGSISVPDGFSVGYDENTVFARLKDNSKTFSVTDKYEKYFDYTEMSVSKPKYYAVFEINDKYSLVISGGARAIARNSDIDGGTAFKLSPCDEELYMFAAVDFNAYSVPVEELSYKSASAKAHAKLLVLGEVTFNGNDYYAVKTENGNGYIRKQFLLSHLAKEKSEEEIRSAYIYLKGGAAAWENADLSGESVLLSEKTKVKVLSIDGDVVKVEYDGGTWFTSKGNLYADGRQKTTKSLAVLLLALSLTTFALFFERRYLYRRGVNE